MNERVVTHAATTAVQSFIKAGNALHFACGGPMFPFRQDGGCYSCGLRLGVDVVLWQPAELERLRSQQRAAKGTG